MYFNNFLKNVSSNLPKTIGINTFKPYMRACPPKGRHRCSVGGCKYKCFFKYAKQKMPVLLLNFKNTYFPYKNFLMIFQISFPNTTAISPISITKPII
jgi:hypothetical protein